MVSSNHVPILTNLISRLDNRLIDEIWLEIKETTLGQQEKYWRVEIVN